MRLTFVCHEFPPYGGGASTALDELTRALAVLGTQVQIITAGPGSCTVSHIHDDGRCVVALGAGRSTILSPSKWELIRSFFALKYLSKKHIKEFKPDAIVSFFAFPAALAIRGSAVSLGIPHFISIRGSDAPGYNKAQKRVLFCIQKILFRKACSNAKALICNGVHLKALSEASLPSNAYITSFKNGVNTNKYNLKQSMIRDPRQKVRFLYVGQLIPRKRVGLLLEAFAEADVPCELSIVGDGPETVDLKRLCSSLGIENKVSFLGSKDRSEIAQVYSESDVLVSLSRAEGVSNVILEAMSSGLAIVAVPTAIDASISERNFFRPIYSPDKSSVAEALRELVDDRQALQYYADCSKDIAQELDWSFRARSFQGWIKNIISSEFIARDSPDSF